MSSNEKEQQIKLEDISLSEIMIQAGNFPANQLFELVVNTRYLGIYWWQDLKDYFSICSDYIDKNDVKLSYYKENDWYSYHNHPIHQDVPIVNPDEEKKPEPSPDPLERERTNSDRQTNEVSLTSPTAPSPHEDSFDFSFTAPEDLEVEEIITQETLEDSDSQTPATEEIIIEQEIESSSDEDHEQVFIDRRKVPQDEEELDAELDFESHQQFYVLKDGQKTGPYQTLEIKQMLEEKKLFYTDAISNDHGAHWQKISVISLFDRRSKEDKLPSSPGARFIKKSKHEIDHQLKQRIERDEEKTEALINLAHIGQKTAKPEQTKTFIMSPNLSSNSSFPWGKTAALFFIVAMAFAGISFIQQMDVSQSTTSTQEAPKPQKLTGQKINKPSVPNQKAKRKSNIRKRTPASSASVSPSAPAYKPLSNNPVIQSAPVNPQARDPEPAPEDDDYYYNDATDPIELEPVQEVRNDAQPKRNDSTRREDEYRDDYALDDYPPDDYGDEPREKRERDVATEEDYPNDYVDDYPPENEDY